MGRHSRRGPAPKSDAPDMTPRRGDRRGARAADAREGVPQPPDGTAADGPAWLPDGTPAQGTPRLADRAAARGVQGVPGMPAAPGGAAGRGAPGFAGGVPGAVGLSDGGSARGVPGLPDGTPARGVPRVYDGAPAGGVPRSPDGTPAHGVPRSPGGTPARGVPRAGGGAAQGARGGHPEQREAGGGWGEFAGKKTGGGEPGVVLPRQRQAEPGAPGPAGGRRRRGPRQEYLDAFDGAAAGTQGIRGAKGGKSAQGTQDAQDTSDSGAAASGAGVPAQRGGSKGWAYTGIAAAAVTTVLAVVVAGQVTHGQEGDARSRSAAGRAPDARAPGDASGAPAPATVPSAAPLTYDQKMGKKYPLGATLTGPGTFDAVPGFDKAPGTGQKYRYRVDVEQGLGLDGALFAEAVQKTLNDRRSWAHGGARTFERVSSGKPDFVITLASPGTTAKWCAKSGLDTTEDNVSCDSAATERVMINAYRWAQGSTTYGDRIHAYRQMLINHEVGHRLGNGHVTCQKDGEPAPVMQQQTKFLDHDGIHCLPNPWPYPAS
ncbi:DUF3152 domain-containing protein [Streptomyces bangladeshensis]|uniref:DUF3152 domain-containing protein n=1 Tax=Streptomyces bangladeshensis TaxID=295352 RepID=A0ABP5NXI6_9ACTN